MDPEKTIGAEEAAHRLGVSVDSVRRYLRSGELRGYQLARRSGWRIDPAELDVFLRLRQIDITGEHDGQEWARADYESGWRADQFKGSTLWDRLEEAAEQRAERATADLVGELRRRGQDRFIRAFKNSYRAVLETLSHNPDGPHVKSGGAA